jgi:hypothetical protein
MPPSVAHGIPMVAHQPRPYRDIALAVQMRAGLCLVIPGADGVTQGEPRVCAAWCNRADFFVWSSWR